MRLLRWAVLIASVLALTGWSHGPPRTPVLTSASPNTGPLAGGTSVVITGINLTRTQSVTFNGVSASFTVNSATKLTATAPAQSGTSNIIANVVATTLDGSSPVTALAQFTYIGLPQISGLSPNSGFTTGQTPNVVITGTNLANPSAVVFGALPAVAFSFNSGTQTITATAPAPNGGTVQTVDVRVTTPGGTSAVTTADQFSYVLPPVATVTAVTPNSTPENTPLSNVAITGTNFLAATAVTFGAPNPASSFTVNSNTQITANAPASSGGTIANYAVQVTTPSGTSSSTLTAGNTFSYTSASQAPVVTAGATVNYTAGNPAIAMDSGLSITGGSSPTLASATVQITGGSVPALDVLACPSICQIVFASSYNSGASGGPLLTITASPPQSIAFWLNVLQPLTFSSTSAANPTRTITWIVNDGGGAPLPVNFDSTTFTSPHVNPIGNSYGLEIDNDGVNAGGFGIARSTTNHITGLYYFEMKGTEFNISTNGVQVGLTDGSETIQLGSTVHSVGLTYDVAQPNVAGNGTSLGNAPIPTDQHVVGIAVDLTNKLIWFRDVTASPTVWNAGGSANPVGEVGGYSISFLTCPCYAAGAVSLTSNTKFVLANFFGGTVSPYAATPPTGFGNW